MAGNEQLLHVGAGAHFAGGTHEYTHLAVTNLREQGFLLHVAVGFVNETDLLTRDAHFHELVPKRIINVECVSLWR